MKVKHLHVSLLPDDSDANLTRNSDWNADHVVYQTYYVSSAGSNSNNGLTTSTPWKDTTAVNGATFLPGDSVLFKGGQTFVGLIVPLSGGTPADPVTFGSYGGDRATISSGTSNGFTSTNLPGIVVRDLIFTGSAAANTGIKFDNNLAGNVHLQNIQVINCKVSGYGGSGIFVTGSNGSAGFDDVLIDGCETSGCCSVQTSGNGSAGIIVQSIAGYGLLVNAVSFRNVVIANCNSHDNTGIADTNWTGTSIFIGETDTGLIYNCRGDNNSTASHGGVGIWAADAIGVTIANCVSTNTGSAFGWGDGLGFDLDGGSVDCVIRDCYASGNVGAGYAVYAYYDGFVTQNSGNKIINCVSDNDGSQGLIAGITLAGSWVNSGMVVAGNTVIQRVGGGDACFRSTNSGIDYGTVTDNTFIVSGSQYLIYDIIPSSLVYDGNRYISAGTCNISWGGVAYTSVATWAAATGQEASSTQNFAALIAGSVGIGDYAPISYDSLLTKATIDIDPNVNWSLASQALGNHTFGAQMVVAKTRGVTPTTHVAVAAGDGIGGMQPFGSDGSAYVAGGFFQFVVDAAVGANFVPTGFEIYTGGLGYGLKGFGVDSNGSVTNGRGAISTTATDGFMYVAGCPGIPTGTPTTKTGLVPIVVDTTDNRLYFYSSGAWRNAGP
ncbi:MAG: right-handed parallel beta-helix repeat-containing protein [Pseudomonadota bacterium]